MQRAYYSFHFLLFSYQFFLTILQFRGCSMTLVLMAYITLLFHNSACFLKTWSAHFADALIVSYFYPCLYSSVTKNRDLTKREVKRPETSKLIPSKMSHNLSAQMEGGYPQPCQCKQTAFKELNKRRRADVNRRNCLSIYHWGTLQCQDVIGDHSGTMKGIGYRQHICLHSWTLKQVQVGRAVVFSIRRLRSSPQPVLSIFPKQACENKEIKIPLCFTAQSESFSQALTKLSENL